MPLVGCTTIGQQITNKNGTIAINQTPEPVKSITVPAPAPKATPAPISSKPTTFETTYESRRVIGSYIVIQ